MKKLILLLSLIVIATAFKAKEDLFVGKIVYQYTFTDLQGNDVSFKMAPYLGLEQNYFIGTTSYKSYTQGKLQQLYMAGTNSYYYFTNNEGQKIDGSTSTSQTFTVKHLNETQKIAGYTCQAIQIETDGTSTIYYYSLQIKTNQKVFAKHNFGEWNKYLEATNGALALKYIMTNKKQGYIWTSTASEVTKATLTDKDFLLPENLPIKE